VGAACANVTEQLEVPPDTTELGEHCNAETVAGVDVTVTDVLAELPFSDAVTRSEERRVGIQGVPGRLPDDAHAATVTDAVTVNAELFEETATADPPAGAAFDKVTVQFEVPPDTTELGEHCNAETVAGVDVTVTDVLAELPFSDAVT